MTPVFVLPVGQFVRIVTIAVAASMTVVMLTVLAFVLQEEQRWLILVVGLTNCTALFAFYALAPRAVSLHNRKLVLHYPLHQREIEIKDAIVSAVNHSTIWPAIRLLGNGGVFAFTGKFRSKALGVYKLYARSHAHGTLFELESGKKIVIGLELKGAWQQILRSHGFTVTESDQ